MKNLFTFILLFIAVNSYSQDIYVNNKNIEDIDSKYIVATIKGYSGLKTTLEIDYGQDTSSISRKVYLVTDEDGKWMYFKGIAQIYNFLYDLGYVYKDLVISDELQIIAVFERKI